MFGPTERSSAGSSPVLILDQRSSLGSVTGWPACCGDFVVLARSKPASLRSRANFCSHAGKTCPAGPVNRGRCQLPPEPMAIAKPRARTDETIGRPGIKNCCRRRCARRSRGRTIAQCFLRLSDFDPTLLDRVGSYEARLWRQQRKRFGRLRRCDSRHLQCSNDCVIGLRPSPGIGRDRSRLTRVSALTTAKTMLRLRQFTA
jgi:hypothetical protein